MLLSLLHEATHGNLRGSFYTKVFSETQALTNLCSVFLPMTAVWVKGLWRIDRGTGMSCHCVTAVFSIVVVGAIFAEMPAVISEKKVAGAGDCGRPNCCRQQKRTGGYLKSTPQLRLHPSRNETVQTPDFGSYFQRSQRRQVRICRCFLSDFCLQEETKSK